ncbi:putative bifunctional diguanylate cyclase/phosphodiesterase [Pseudomarimonas arenosa]|uniref:EAL domain-containing protein n=1 Tax=Pseudomarimonas arenosa TaxID=2774145 RepID=A0AAW3ZL23_9GAMM|nr:EAL domain-containing protein [Pseudomarimonas arenosa]MBD8525767.1 EAL domain-containing protein [Pseudomarimonas arenosa]
MASSRVVRLRFGTKVLLLIVSLIGAMLLIDTVAMRLAVRTVVDEQSAARLEVGARVWRSLRENRSRQMLEQVAVFSEDFGFKEAVATRDLPTLQSVLHNASLRLDLPHALLLSVEGEPIASLDIALDALNRQRLPALLQRARTQGSASGVVVIADRPISFALVPVFAPHQVAWLAMGSEFGGADIAELAGLTGLEAVIALHGDGGWQLIDADGQRQAMPTELIDALQGGGQRIELPAFTEAHDPSLALRVSEPEFSPLYLLISAPTATLISPFQQLQQRALVWTSAVTVLALLVASLFGRVLQQRVRRLADAAEQVRAGRYDQPLALSGNDELRELADAFNLMQASISEREKQIVFSSGHDGLTRLPNRERAISLLDRRLAEQRGSGRSALLMVIEVRRFRDINDLFGYAFGDRALVELANRLRAQARDTDPLARLGGDEFMLSLWGLGAEQTARRIKQVSDALAEPFLIDQVPLSLDFNFGVVDIGQDEVVDASTLLRRADVAMNEAKLSGEGLMVYEAGLDERHQRQLQLIRHMAEGLSQGEFFLQFQPKVNLADDQVSFAEALLRWKHPQLGPIPPDEFIALAERSDLIGQISRWVVEQAVAQVARWSAQGVDCGLALNLSAHDVVDPALPGIITDTLRRHRVSPQKIILEITESAVMRDLNAALSNLDALRRAGLTLSIDDFGTGHSSLAQLKRLPVDELKIDRSFVLSLMPGTEDERIVDSVLRLAHALGLRVVAEGVESAEGLDVLRRLGCEVVQGYYFSRPLAADDFVRWWQQRRTVPAKDSAA